MRSDIFVLLRDTDDTVFSICAGGYRHVKRTGDIKDLVITEESGIAKGIRRIIAVTGTEAREVSRTATALEAELVLIEKKSGKDKDTALKAYAVVSHLHLKVLSHRESRTCSGALTLFRRLRSSALWNSGRFGRLRAPKLL